MIKWHWQHGFHDNETFIQVMDKLNKELQLHVES
jgi:hypothetical protein